MFGFNDDIPTDVKVSVKQETSQSMTFELTPEESLIVIFS